ncbi:hypothetical protein DFH27DRAFT_610010 [Peziza echinospora]|nr:hypothetical protein DFH27DRAFT_610010 [Peziza echinospora]
MSQEWVTSSTQTRRKSFGFFSRPSMLQDIPDLGPVSTPRTLHKNPTMIELSLTRARPKSMFFSGPGGITEELDSTISLPQPRGKLSKRPRPKSMFGSFKPRESSFVTESSGSSSAASSHEREDEIGDFGVAILHHGEVLSTGGLLRRRKEFLVLTTKELLRYKSQQKAWDNLGQPCNSTPRTPTTGRTASFSSTSDLTTTDRVVAQLDQIVSVYKPDVDNNPSTIQVDHMDDISGPGSTVFQLQNVEEADVWIDAIRTAATISREVSEKPLLSTNIIAHIARRLEAERDYVPDQFFRVYTIVQRGTNGKSHHRSSSDDLSKMYSTICYLAIGLHKVHIVPIPKTLNRSTTSLVLNGGTVSSGILNLSSISMSDKDDSFTLGFRLPCRTEMRLNLASCHAASIVQSIRQISEYLRPEWIIPPFTLDIPEFLKDEPIAPLTETKEDYNCIDRTLAAYCAAYDLDASSICYGVLTDVEDGPQFVLYPPANTRRKTYSDLELLAVLKSLRWNESFGSISFRGISLDPLMKAYDKFADEPEFYANRSGKSIFLKPTDVQRPVLVLELRALAMCSTKLRKLDFYESIVRKRKGGLDFQNVGEESEGCGVVEAVMPLCRRGYTNVDWFNLTGIELVESDLDWLVDAAATKLAHFRGFELGRCGLTERMVSLFLAALVAHENTLEALDLSGNPGRFHAPSLNTSMCYFPYLRKLNLSRVLRATGTDPLLTAEVLLRWRLEELDLSETQLNGETVDAISTYLASPQSDALHELWLTQTGITSHDAATLMYSMTSVPGKARDMHLHIGQNPLQRNHSELVEAISAGATPSHLTMRMVDYPKEEMFRELIKALTINKTIQYLDLSKISLPYEAGPDTCAALGEFFAKNTSIIDLDLSGEQAVLETARLGVGINSALGRLAENHTLQTLRIELQTLGTSGAMVLSQMLRKNTTLRQLHCDMNRIFLQGFSAIVNALEYNTTLLYLPTMEMDRAEQMKAFKSQISINSANGDGKRAKVAKKVSISDHHQGSTQLFQNVYPLHLGKLSKPSPASNTSNSAASLSSTLVLGDEVLQFGSNGAPVPLGLSSSSDPQGLLRLMENKWEAEVNRLMGVLVRNVTMLEGGDQSSWESVLANAFL